MAFVMLRFRRTSAVLSIGVLGWLVLFSPSCLRTLDESLIPNGHGGQAGSDAGGSDASAGSGGSSGSAGSAGADSGTDAQADAPHDAFPEGSFTPWDSSQHPLTALYCESPAAALVIAADDKNVYHIPRGVKASDPNDVLAATPLSSSSNPFQIDQGDIPAPQAMAAPKGSLFIYVAAGAAGGADVGSMLRAARSASSGVSAISSTPIELAVGIFADSELSDPYAYVSSQALASGLTPAVLRFGLAASVNSATTLYSSRAGSETGGPITVSGGCVYWVSSGAIWTVPTTTANSDQRKSALAKQVSDAVGLASDANNIYYTRANGEVWQKTLTASCDGSTGTPEKLIARGYTSIGGVIAYNGTVAWAARGDATKNYQGGGIFTTPAGGYDVTQIAPNTDQSQHTISIDQITSNSSDVVYSSDAGCIFMVPQ